jgi:ribosomal protein S27AE
VRRTRRAQHSGCISPIEERELESVYSSSVGKEVVDESRKCPMCGHTTWVLLDGHSTFQALEGGLEALAYSCEKCGFIRWHRLDMTKPPA